jgi:hypothetical protein
MRQSAGELEVRLGSDDVLNMNISSRYETNATDADFQCQHSFSKKVNISSEREMPFMKSHKSLQETIAPPRL